MITVLLVVHLLVTLALIGVVLIQRSEGGGLGVGTSQGMGTFMSGRGTANLLTRATAVLAALFFVLSMALALLNRGTTVNSASSILDSLPTRAGAPISPAMTPNPGVTRPAAPPSPAPPSQAPAPQTKAPASPAPATGDATPGRAPALLPVSPPSQPAAPPATGAAPAANPAAHP